jgi:hypothetical protein
VGGEVGAHLVFGGVKRQISNVKFRHKTTHKIKRQGGRLSALPAGASRIL